MVVFTCNNCGETLQKPRVAKHYQFQCRTAAFLTCVDCFTDFRGQEYVTHTKCITEAQRYGGKDYVPKAGANKGERKQQEWLNIVNNLLDNNTSLTNVERGFLTSLSKYENIPRKKAKFLNFIRSAMGHKTHPALVESVWNKMETAYKNCTQNLVESEQPANGTAKEQEDVNQDNTNGSLVEEHQHNNIAENQNNENICRENKSETQENEQKEPHNADNDDDKVDKPSKKKKSKKRTMSEGIVDQDQPVSKKKSKNSSVLLESSINQCNDTTERVTFDWKSTILDIVQNKGEVSLKKLQKKVIAQYMSHCPDAVIYEKACSKFNKKLKKIPEIVLSEDRATLA